MIYERLLPAVPTSVTRIRDELVASLARHDVEADRSKDIALVVTEAATNVVLHAYRDTPGGPLYAFATRTGDALTVSICDCGSGMRDHPDSAGLGLGIPLMARLSDDLFVSSDPGAEGTCVHACFERAGAMRTLPEDAAVSPVSERGEIFREYLNVLRATHAELEQDTRALVAQAQQAVARARRQRAGASPPRRRGRVPRSRA